MTPAKADITHNIQSYCVVPNAVQAPGVKSAGYRGELKRKADAMSRLQYEVYSFATTNNLSEAAVDELLGMPSNLCTFQHVELLHIFTYYYNLLLHTKFYSIPVQERFSPEDIQHKESLLKT